MFTQLRPNTWADSFGLFIVRVLHTRTYLLLFPLPLLLLQSRSRRIAAPAVLGDGERGAAGHAGGHRSRRRRHRRGRRGGALRRRVGRRGAAALCAAEGSVEGVERGAEMVVFDAAGRVRVLFLELKEARKFRTNSGQISRPMGDPRRGGSGARFSRKNLLL